MSLSLQLSISDNRRIVKLTDDIFVIDKKHYPQRS